MPSLVPLSEGFVPDTTVILALDPGQTTGACLISTAPTDKGFEVLWAGEITWADRFTATHALINGVNPVNGTPLPPPQILVMEDFRLRQGRAYEQSGSHMPSSIVIGIATALWWERATTQEVVYQEPGAISRVVVPEEDVSWVKGSPHKQDAYRHARYYYIMHERIKGA